MKIKDYKKEFGENFWGQFNSEFKSSGYHMPSTDYDEQYYFQYIHSINMIFVWK